MSDPYAFIASMQYTTPGHRYIGTSGIAKRFGKSIKTVHRWVEAGHLIPVGRLENGAKNDALIFLLSDIESYEQQVVRK